MYEHKSRSKSCANTFRYHVSRWLFLHAISLWQKEKDVADKVVCLFKCFWLGWPPNLIAIHIFIQIHLWCHYTTYCVIRRDCYRGAYFPSAVSAWIRCIYICFNLHESSLSHLHGRTDLHWFRGIELTGSTRVDSMTFRATMTLPRPSNNPFFHLFTHPPV